MNLGNVKPIGRKFINKSKRKIIATLYYIDYYTDYWCYEIKLNFQFTINIMMNGCPVVFILDSIMHRPVYLVFDPRRVFLRNRLHLGRRLL